MRHFIAIAFVAVIAALGVQSAVAADKNPFEFTKDKFKRGVVIVAIDDAPPGWDAAKPKLDYTLDIHWYDQAKKKPHIEIRLMGDTPFTAIFQTVTDDQGHRFLVGSMGEGEALIASYYAQFSWGMCYDAATYRFYVKGGTYNFIGRFDDRPSFDAIDRAIQDGRLPAQMAPNARTRPITGYRLEGFTTGDLLPDTRQRAGAVAAKWLGHPVEITTPVMTPTTYNISKNPLGDIECAYWASGSDRPDRSPLPPEAPAVDGAAKPSSDVVNWLPRPKAP